MADYLLRALRLVRISRGVWLRLRAEFARPFPDARSAPPAYHPVPPMPARRSGGGVWLSKRPVTDYRVIDEGAVVRLEVCDRDR